MVTWYILPQNFWLCSLFVHLDIQKNTSTLSFFYILVFTMHGNGFGRSPYIPKPFSNRNTYTYACMHKKVFLSAHFPTFTLHQTKSLKAFYFLCIQQGLLCIENLPLPHSFDVDAVMVVVRTKDFRSFSFFEATKYSQQRW